MSRLEARVPPVIWWALSAFVVLVVDVAVGGQAGTFGRGLGGLFLLAGIGVSLAALSQFGKAQTTSDPHNISNASTLVTEGVYRLTRNPMYLGLLSLAIGWGLWRGTILGSILGGLTFVACVTGFQIIPEERVLEENFGDEYVEYKARTRRWL